MCTAGPSLPTERRGKKGELGKGPRSGLPVSGELGVLLGTQVRVGVAVLGHEGAAGPPRYLGVHLVQPKILDNPLYLLLREDRPKEFNKRRHSEAPIDLRYGNFRGNDLRGADLRQVDFEGAYFRSADLRGLDLSQTNLRGASLADAKVSGVLFPDELTPEEIRLSVELGTRLRYRQHRG